MQKSNTEEAIEGIKIGTQIAVQNFVMPAVDMFLSSNPKWSVSWWMVKGLYGSLFAYQQEKINYLVQFLNDNREMFPEKDVETAEFQEGFVITFENYLKQRGEKRREIIEHIFLDFAVSVDKSEFELERLYRTSELISLDSVKFLGYLGSSIWPTLSSDILSGSAKGVHLSEMLGRYFRENKRDRLAHDYSTNYLDHANELVTLGIFSYSGYKTVIEHGESHMTFSFSEFGLRFIRYILNL
jgi:hypothetical protein